MKIWMNDLKPNDYCYVINGDNVAYCRVIGDANNMSFRMPRITLEPIDIHTGKTSYTFEMFVNTYAYDNYEEAVDVLLEQLNTKMGKLKNEREILDNHIEYLNIYIDRYKRIKERLNDEDEILDYPYLGGLKKPNKQCQNVLSEESIERMIGG